MFCGIRGLVKNATNLQIQLVISTIESELNCHESIARQKIAADCFLIFYDHILHKPSQRLLFQSSQSHYVSLFL